MRSTLPSLIIALTLAGCGGAKPDNASNVVNAAANAVDMTAIPEDVDAVALDNGGTIPAPDSLATDAWVGRWNGPEGLFLDIQRDETPGAYELTLKDTLDAQHSYAGTAEDATIRFARAGKSETIRAGTGKETGYKWLADKSACLIIVAGKEGYCR